MRYPKASLVWVRMRSERSRSPIGFPLASFFHETCSKSRINCLHWGATFNRRSRLAFANDRIHTVDPVFQFRIASLHTKGGVVVAGSASQELAHNLPIRPRGGASAASSRRIAIHRHRQQTVFL